MAAKRPYRAKGVVTKWPPVGFAAVTIYCPCRFDGKVYLRTGIAPGGGGGLSEIAVPCPRDHCAYVHTVKTQ